MRTTVVLVTCLTITAACGGAGPTEPAPGATSPAISPDTITLAVGESVTFTIAPSDRVSAIEGGHEFPEVPIVFRPVRITSAAGVWAELRLVGEVVPKTKIWQPGTRWDCCSPPVLNLWVSRAGVVVEVQNPHGHSDPQTVTLVATPL